MRDPQTLVHFANLEEFAEAQRQYAYYAAMGKKPNEVDNPLITQFSSLLFAIMSHRQENELRYEVKRLLDQRQSTECFRDNFIALVRSHFIFDGRDKAEGYRAVFDHLTLRLSELPLRMDLDDYCNQLPNIMDEIAEQFAERTTEAKQELERSRQERSIPEECFKRLNNNILPVYQGMDEKRPEYFHACAQLTRKSSELEKNYLAKTKNGERPVLDESDRLQYIDEYSEAIDYELEHFVLKCEDVKREFLNVRRSAFSIDALHKTVLQLVDVYGGEDKAIIAKKIMNINRYKPGRTYVQYLGLVRKAVREQVNSSRKEKTKQDYFTLLTPVKKNTVDPMVDLRQRGIQSEQFLEFLMLRLNKDGLAKSGEYHEQELKQFFKIDLASAREGVTLDFDSNTHTVLLKTRVIYEKVALLDDVTRVYKGDVAERETIIQIQEIPGVKENSYEVSLIKSEMHFHDKALRRDYFLKKLYLDDGIFSKLTQAKPLSKEEDAIVQKYLALDEVGDSAEEQLSVLSGKAKADDLFLRAWRDKLFLQRLFNPAGFEPLDTEQNDDQPNDLEGYADSRHWQLLQKLCEMPHPLERLDAIKRRHTYHDHAVYVAFQQIDCLKSCLQDVKNRHWQVVSTKLNDPATRKLMMSAMHSLDNVKEIQEALASKSILYSLDANTLLHFALKDETMAKKILHQSVWQRLGVKIRQWFKGGEHCDLPVNKLKSEHVIQLAQRYPDLWRTSLKPRNAFACSVTGHRNLSGLLKYDDLVHLGTKGSEESKRAASEAIHRHSVLRQTVMNRDVLTPEIANNRVNMLSNFGLSYEDRMKPAGREMLRFGLEEPAGYRSNLYSVADDATVENFLYNGFLQLFLTKDNKILPKGSFALHDAIARLWHVPRQMQLPNRPNIDAVAKRAMTRVLRTYPDVYLNQYNDGLYPEDIMLEQRENFYKEIFKDEVILSRFIGDNKFKRYFARISTAGLRQYVLNLVKDKYLACREGYGGSPAFTLEQVAGAFDLYKNSDTPFTSDPAISGWYIDILLQHYDKPSLISSLIDSTIEDITILLQHATPLQLQQFLLRNFTVQNNHESRMRQIREMAVRITQLPANEAKAELQGRLQKLQHEFAKEATVAQFFNSATAAIKEHPHLLEKVAQYSLMPVFYAEPTLINQLTERGLLKNEVLQAFDEASLFIPPHKIAKVFSKNENVRLSVRRSKRQKNHLKNGMDKEMGILFGIKSTQQDNKEDVFSDPRVNRLLNSVKETIAGLKDLDTSPAILDGIKDMIRAMATPIDYQLLYFSFKRLLLDNQFISKIYDGSTLTANACVDFFALLDRCMPSITETLTRLAPAINHEKRIIDFREEFAQGCLISACTNEAIRQQIFSNPTLQKKLAVHGNLKHVMLFLLSSKGNKDVVLNWGFAFEKLHDPQHADLLDEYWPYLIENVPGFANEYLSAINRRKPPFLDMPKIQKMMKYNLNGHELLTLYDRECVSEGWISTPRYFIRDLLLSDNRLLLRAFDFTEETVTHRLSANDRVDFLKREIHAFNESKLLELSAIATHLLSQDQLKFMVSYADAKSIAQLLRKPLPDFVSKPLYRALLEAYQTRSPVRDELNKDPYIVKQLLRHSTWLERIHLAWDNDVCLEAIMNDAELFNDYSLRSQYSTILLAYARGRENSAFGDVADSLSSRVLPHLYQTRSTSLVMRVLPHLVNDALNDDDLREKLDHYLNSTEFAESLTSAEPQDLVRLFRQTTDPRAIRRIFFEGTPLSNTLMARCWLELSPTDLMNMMSHEFKTWKVLHSKNRQNIQSEPWCCAAAMLRTLLEYMSVKGEKESDRAKYIDSAKDYCQRFLLLCENKEFLKAILERVTISQLDKLMSTDPEIAKKITDYFSENTPEFLSALSRGSDSGKAKKLVEDSVIPVKSQLNQLLDLFKHHESMARLFVSQVETDPLVFDTIVIDHVRTASQWVDTKDEVADHESVHSIFDLIYQLEGVGADFYHHFSVPLHGSKTRIFLFLHLLGGLPMIELYNKDPNHLEVVWNSLVDGWAAKHQGRHETVGEIKGYMAQLKRKDVAGNVIKWLYLTSPSYMATNPKRIVSLQDPSTGDTELLSRTEAILFSLYPVVKIMREMITDQSKFDEFIHPYSATLEIRELYVRILEADKRIFDPLISASTPLQLAHLFDADSGLKKSITPLLDRLVSDAGIVEKIKTDPKACLALIETKAFRKLVLDQKNLQQLLLWLFPQQGTQLPISRSTMEDPITHKVTEATYWHRNGNVYDVCSEDEYRMMFAAKEFFEFGHRKGASDLRSLLHFDQGEFKIRGPKGQPSVGKAIPPKYLSTFFYSQFVLAPKEFVAAIEGPESLYREAFTQCIQIKWKPSSPEGRHYTQLARRDDDCYPHVELSLSRISLEKGLSADGNVSPYADLVVMYCYAQYLNHQNRRLQQLDDIFPQFENADARPDDIDPMVYGLIALDHVLTFNGAFYFSNQVEGRCKPVPKDCAELLTRTLASLSEEKRQNIIQRSKERLKIPSKEGVKDPSSKVSFQIAYQRSRMENNRPLIDRMERMLSPEDSLTVSPFAVR